MENVDNTFYRTIYFLLTFYFLNMFLIEVIQRVLFCGLMFLSTRNLLSVIFIKNQFIVNQYNCQLIQAYNDQGLKFHRTSQQNCFYALIVDYIFCRSPEFRCNATPLYNGCNISTKAINDSSHINLNLFFAEQLYKMLSKIRFVSKVRIFPEMCVFNMQSLEKSTICENLSIIGSNCNHLYYHTFFCSHSPQNLTHHATGYHVIFFVSKIQQRMSFFREILSSFNQLFVGNSS
eukprot:TRINITY_DN3242_c0_g3_i1.p2 TRINITY_DN3242_c0_g3~~TRINITY_DN3242_c0_g3_i1.p2  ORF type:complete len:233 (-),score=-17.98 TRINITY_DN3242_c0_g3_i1:995-1693(-)